jgi:uncharacterized lipoprotein YehR (DUF1307 family)
MKKIIYIILFALVSSLSITSCTKEEVKPQVGPSSAGAIKE